MFETVLIVDDEPVALDRLERLLIKLGVNKIYKAENCFQAKKILNENPQIKIIFLDIRMPGKSGLDFAKEIITEKEDCVIILQTAYEEYALEGFKIGSIDYLVKPYGIDEVKRALERAKKFLGEEEKKFIQVIDSKGTKRIISLENILYIKADLKHSIIRTKEGFYFSHLNLGTFEKKLKKYGFVRIHRSYLINPSKIYKIEEGPYGKLILLFKENIEKIITSKSGASIFRKIFAKLNDK